MALATIQIDSVAVGTRLRQISEAQVEALVASIGDVGLLNPITVYPRKIMQSSHFIDGYGLVAGAHRLEASKRLGLVDIAAHVVDLEELERQIAECDENLCASILTKAERALFTKRRKDAYEALHPETKHGANQHTRSPKVEDSSNVDRFTLDTAKKTGRSEQSVQRDAERGGRIDARALALVTGTKLDNGSYLDKLKSVPAADQVGKVKADLATTKAKSVRVARDPKNDDQVKEEQVAALMAAWNRANKQAREEFLSRIDAPVFDRSAA
jgi:ParB family transcriptional regulator, chromosome partitioning protein